MTATVHAEDCIAGRWDIYGPVHKGLRRAHAMMLVRLGNADFSGEVSPLLDDLRAHLAMAAAHLADEEAFIHAALESRAPGCLTRLEAQHDHHRDHLRFIEDAIRRIEAGDDVELAGRRLYRRFTRFVADDLDHMDEEETVVFPLLCRHFTDAELMAIEHAIVGSLDPAMSGAFAVAMLGAANIDERILLLSGMHQGMPTEVYALMFEAAVRPVSSEADLARLAALGLVA